MLSGQQGRVRVQEILLGAEQVEGHVIHDVTLGLARDAGDGRLGETGPNGSANGP
jgi:hypothetical protein